jgi:hypothetical protein
VSAQVGATNIDFYRVPPRIWINVPIIPERRDYGSIIDQDIYRPELLRHRADNLFHRVPIGDIGREHARGSARCSNQRMCFVQLPFCSCRKCDVDASHSKCLGEGTTEAAPASGDQCNLAAEVTWRTFQFCALYDDVLSGTSG